MTFGLALPFLLLLWSYIYWLWGSLTQLPAGMLPALLTGVVAGGIVFFLVRKKFFQTKRSFWGGDIWVFFILFIAGLFLRSWMPVLDQTEKFPDMAMLQAVTLDRHFPPIDRFLSGETLNYYFFGYLLFSPLLQVLRIPLEWGFNLSLVLIFSMLACGGYAIVRELGGTRIAALFSALALTFGSNWEWTRQLLARAKPFFWWDSSRVIPGTINEFPFFSYLVGDLHAHYMEIPWLTLALFLLYSLRRECQKVSQDRNRILLLSLFCSVAIGVHYPLNPWGVPFLGLLSILMLGRWPHILALVGIGSFTAFLPYWLNYSRPVSSIAWVGWGNQSPPFLFFLHWGPFLVPVFLALPLLFRERAHPKSWSVEARLLFLSFFLIGCCEVIYFRDAFSSGEFFRINTVFKFYLVAWWGLSISAPLILAKKWNELPFSPRIRLGILMGVVAASLVYPILGTRSRLGGHIPVPTLDGMAYWGQAFPGEREVIQWIRRETSPNDVILEAPGPLYQHFGRIAAFSGRPTLLAWASHQWVWRTNGREMTLVREAAIKQLQNEAEFYRFSRQYRVRWVVVGALERSVYPPPFLQFLAQLPVAYQSATTTLYAVPAPIERQ